MLRRIGLPLAVRVFIAVACSFAGSANAVNWGGGFVVQPSLIYTDNICLSKNDKKDDWTGMIEVAPEGEFTYESSRTTAEAGGALRFNTLSNGDLRDDGCTGDDLDDREKWFPSLYGAMNTVLTSNEQFDASIRIDQNQVNSARGSSNDGLNRNGNDNTFYRYSLSPSTSRKLTSGVQFNGRYAYSSVINTADEANDSDRHSLNGRFNGDLGPRLTWGLTGRASITSYKDDFYNQVTETFAPREDTELKSLSLRLGYEVIRTLEFNGTYGWEWNDFATSSNNDKGGSAWDVGLRWTPNERTMVSVGSGDRFFGKTPRVSFTYRGRRSTFDGSYRKRITFQRDLTTVGLGGELDVEGGGFDTSESINNIGALPGTGFDNNGDPTTGLPTSTAISSSSVILDERTTLVYSYIGRPGRISWWGSYSKQTRAEDGAEADFMEWDLTWSPNLSPKWSLTSAFTYREVIPQGFQGGFDISDEAESEEWQFRLLYSKPFNTHVGLGLEYRFTDRQSDVRLDEYQENMVQIKVNIRL